jgi:hypothetical protein
MKTPLKEALTLTRISILRGKVGSQVSITRGKGKRRMQGHTVQRLLKNGRVFSRTGHGRVRKMGEDAEIDRENIVTACGIKGYGGNSGAN